MPIRKLRLSQVTVDAGTDTRHEINDTIVDEYGEAAKAGAKFPPLIAFLDSNKDEYFLADGFHRYFGYERYGVKEFEVDVRNGTRKDALKFGLGCNNEHGYRRTNKDKLHCVEMAVKEFDNLSDRVIAELCKVSHSMVGEVRKAMKPEPSEEAESSVPARPAKREGKDGKMRPVSKKKVIEVEETEELETEKILDATGLRVPPEIVPYWKDSTQQASDLLTAITNVSTRLKQAHKGKGKEPMFSEVDLIDDEAKLDLVKADLKRMKPFAVCFECQGVNVRAHDKKTGQIAFCKGCGGRGFISQFWYENNVPQEKKDFREKALALRK